MFIAENYKFRKIHILIKLTAIAEKHIYEIFFTCFAHF